MRPTRREAVTLTEVKDGWFRDSSQGYNTGYRSACLFPYCVSLLTRRNFSWVQMSSTGMCSFLVCPPHASPPHIQSIHHPSLNDVTKAGKYLKILSCFCALRQSLQTVVSWELKRVCSTFTFVFKDYEGKLLFADSKTLEAHDGKDDA